MLLVHEHLGTGACSGFEAMVTGTEPLGVVGHQCIHYMRWCLRFVAALVVLQLPMLCCIVGLVLVCCVCYKQHLCFCQAHVFAINAVVQ